MAYSKPVKSILITAVILSAAGVPIYVIGEMGLSVASPINLGAMLSLQATTTVSPDAGLTGNFILWEIYHWGEWPTVADLAPEIAGVLAGFLGYFLTADEIQVLSLDIATTFLADGTITDVALEATVDSFIVLDPITLAAIATPIVAW